MSNFLLAIRNGTMQILHGNKSKRNASVAVNSELQWFNEVKVAVFCNNGCDIVIEDHNFDLEG